MEPVPRRGRSDSGVRLAAVLEATSDLNRMLAEPDRLYASLLERLAETVPFATGSLQLLEGDALRVVAFLGGFDPSVVANLRFELVPSYPNFQVLSSKRSVSVADVRESYPHFWTRKEKFDSGHIRSWLGVPLVVADEAIGIIALDRTDVDPFDPSDVRIVEAFAAQAAVALHNARLYGELKEALAAREALVRETHHRVKNSLQLVASLIDIHMGAVDDPYVRTCLEELKLRVGSISSIHARLYAQAGIDDVELDEYLRGLAEDIHDSFTRPGSVVYLRYDMQTLRVPPDTGVTLGLIAGELLINAFKYAFPGGSGSLSLGLRATAAEGILTIEDTGPGMSPVDSGERCHDPKGNEAIAEVSGSSGFGLCLVRSLSAQLGGVAELESRPGRTCWTVRFSLGA